MRTIRGLFLGLSAVMAIALLVLVRARIIPLGVRNEWEWHHITATLMPIDLLLAGLGVVAYAAFVMFGMAALNSRACRIREAVWLACLLCASVAIQVVVHAGAPTGYGITKWVTLLQTGSSGYLTVAKSQMQDPVRFWADYPQWIKTQDSLHVGTHPPGLFLVSAMILQTMESKPELTRAIVTHLPGSVSDGFRIFPGTTTQAERASAAIIGALTLLACATTVVPLYLLARASLSAPTSWAVAALWPIAPSAILFQPTADTAFPLLATSALALVAWGGIGRSILAGVVLGLGLQFTLAFLPVGLAVAIVQARRSNEASWKYRSLTILATGVGFLGITGALWAISGANPWVIWWWNQTNHARFYVESPKSYLTWIIVNPIELFVAIGIPAAVFAVVGFGSRTVPPSAWAALIVLTVLDLSGKNLSEVARLWLPFMPSLLAASGAGMARVGGGPRTLGGTVLMVGFLTLGLEATIQVVYPF